MRRDLRSEVHGLASNPLDIRSFKYAWIDWRPA